MSATHTEAKETDSAAVSSAAASSTQDAFDRDGVEHMLHALADIAVPIALRHFRTAGSVHNKAAVGAAYDPVTQADRAIERALRDHLARHLPDHGVVGEEFSSENRQGRFQWVIDPIDGTRAFIVGAPTWGVLIGVSVDGKPAAGIMVQPFTGERFWSDGSGSWLTMDAGAWRRDKAAALARQDDVNNDVEGDGKGAFSILRTRSTSTLSGARMATTDPSLFGEGAAADAFARLRSRVQLTRFGLDCYAYAMLAAGHLDLVVECGLAPYDIVALVPIIEQAGGTVTTWEGGSPAGGGRIIAAAHSDLHAQALEILAPAHHGA